MDISIAFFIFFGSLFFSLSKGITVLLPLLLGLAAFLFAALRRGHKLSALCSMMQHAAKKSMIVLKIFLLIGILTAVWRACGTISFIVYHAIAFMSAEYFLLSAFVLCCLVSALLGTSFGTVGTIGVVLMVLAQSGQADPTMTAGAIIAGAYFGDRCSPLSSSANLVSALTQTELHLNLKNMLKTTLLPLALSLAAYAYLSQFSPLHFYNDQMSHEITQMFRLDAIVFLPALLILLLTLFKVDVKRSMALSILCGILIAIFIQGISPEQMLQYIVSGYRVEGGGPFAAIIQGGGLYSMLNVALIVLISSAYSGIFSGTGFLRDLEELFATLGDKIGLYASTILASIITASFSCNQTLAVMLTHQFLHKSYAARRLSSYRLAVDLENTVIVISPLIPWNIAGAFPAAALSVDSGFILYAFYLFLVPLCNLCFPASRLSVPVCNDAPLCTKES
ncbi:Na+/H+ antiporter NhaC family protein [Azotosporobacter soli]|uniref:Na+/H+ antiporter NhaC family protein n=1 Tax=Azotosporobacter soli TaxID=3055040 RepID=UPI0031FE573C